MTLLSRREFLEAAGITGAVAVTAGVGAPAHASPTAGAAASKVDLSRVARVAIHPAVGFARVGNSQEAFYFGPEVPGMAPRGPFKDAAGAMAKQANIERKFFDWWFDKTTNVPGIFGDAQIKAVSQARQIGKDMGMIANVPDLRSLVWDKTLRA